MSECDMTVTVGGATYRMRAPKTKRYVCVGFRKDAVFLAHSDKLDGLKRRIRKQTVTRVS